ncbi:glycerol-3-phosphate dehydrogenase/oxidase [Roseibium salinum]|uniref:Glycerol-3-phosphate dehydrogenase/oxidase n=1 Tax=Roseibium salinum TaxID=1604349 RepID=A0ABT3QWU6_9HYPH|nr:glycerol-3-phosphate dehydrogenase/oxidase [Roseibium sp. DSM 29163]MCX2721401.1 glycerol-3-phosphate dehydrogenase/oxidase [Roseibium sp. DSM 29163]
MSDQRQKNWDSIRGDGAFDVIVVGGGINGVGVYRELALQELRVLIVERGDFCSGCSAAPSRMIHGGLRYLENGEFNLVRESLRERDALLKNASHLVHPLPTVIPINSIFSGLMNSAASFFGISGKPSSRGAIPIKIGLSLYDWVTRTSRLLPVHTFRSKSATRAKWPELMPGLKFSATYHDAWISHPERLGIELLTDVAREAAQCVALNYAEIRPAGDGFTVRNALTNETLPVSARMIVNATGAWLDDTISQISGKTGQEPLVSGTKGSHLIIDNPELQAELAGHMVYFENSDGRVCIVFPYLGKVLAGSTDIRVKSAKRVSCTPEEQDYILGSLQLVFPGIEIASSDVVFSYAGIRPLPKSDHDFTGRISRGHFTRRIEGTVPQLCMIGGKWTTFRAFAEQAADEILKELNVRRKTATLALPIGGGKDYPREKGALEKELVSTFGATAERSAYLAAVYGTNARNVLRFCQLRDDDQLIDEALPLTFAEAAYLIRHEFVETLSDLVLRRTSFAIDGRLSRDLIDGLTALLCKELGLSAQDADRQRSALIDELEAYHGVTGQMLESRNLNRSKLCV